ncbi:MAG: N-acetylneuraminate synthase family protein [Phycisphaerae bacterium]
MSAKRPHHDAPRLLAVGRRLIGPGQPTFVIAEVGVNHDGRCSKALELIDVAVAAGADAVKVQVFAAEELVTRSARAADYQVAACGVQTQFEMLAKLELTREALSQIKERCTDRGIELIATPFGPKALECVAELGTAAIKIASTDVAHERLVAAAAATGRPLIVSTGASRRDEMLDALHAAYRAAPDCLAVLHCVSCYPTPVDALNLKAMHTLQRHFAVPVGLSDHTTSTQTGGWAVAAGAQLIEKHITLDSKSSGPDHGFSLPPKAFDAYVAAIRAADAAMGTGLLGMAPIEEQVRQASRRSVVAGVDIPRGTRLRPDMLTLKRPGTGIDPSCMGALVGRTAAVDIKSDTVMAWTMVR